ncbi:MAG: hypothetical protein PSV16_05870 [Flavobacterium sp.]|nr:hypothetical protein [Flavobacterium sp.]
MKSLIAFLFLIVTIPIFAQKNLISNGNFDTDATNWRGDALKFNRIYKYSGTGSGMINQFVGAEWKGVDQISNIPKTTYAIEFTVFIKSEGIEGGKENYNAGVMTIEFTTAVGQSVSYENIAEVKGSNDWKMYKRIVILPPNAKQFRTMLALAQTPGTIYFDDVKAVALSEAEYNEIKH